MKIAIDAGTIKSGDAVRGIGFHTKRLVGHLKKIKGLKVDLVDFSKVDLSKYDIAHYQKFHPYFLSLPLKKKTKTVVTIHDLIYLIYPQHYPAGIRGRLKFFLQKYLVKKADAIITISQTSKKDIVRFLDVQETKIEVVYLAADEIFKPIEDGRILEGVKTKYSLPDEFVLYVGDVNYNKNLLTLAKACELAKLKLVIVGKQAANSDFDKNHPENKPLVSFLKEFGSSKDVLRLGFVPDEDLVTIFNLATLYCQPSFYEGFGLPLLEAFACGIPVVASKIQAHVEIAGNACLYADPKDPGDFAAKITKVIKDAKIREELIVKGRERVKEYSWDKVAKETANVYQKVFNQH